jgi:hypothetical protein
MSIRIGKKIGKTYVSTGKSGLYMRRKVGDIYVSKFVSRSKLPWFLGGNSKKKSSRTMVEDTHYNDIIYETTPFFRHFLINVVVSFLTLLTGIYLTKELMAPVIVAACLYVIVQTCLSIIHREEEGRLVAFYAPLLLLISVPGIIIVLSVLLFAILVG